MIVPRGQFMKFDVYILALPATPTKYSLVIRNRSKGFMLYIAIEEATAKSLIEAGMKVR